MCLCVHMYNPQTYMQIISFSLGMVRVTELGHLVSLFIIDDTLWKCWLCACGSNRSEAINCDWETSIPKPWNRHSKLTCIWCFSVEQDKHKSFERHQGSSYINSHKISNFSVQLSTLSHIREKFYPANSIFMSWWSIFIPHRWKTASRFTQK